MYRYYYKCNVLCKPVQLHDNYNAPLNVTFVNFVFKPHIMNDLDVKKIRIKIGLSQEKFGLLLGVSRNSVAKWESQESKPAMNNAFKILEIDSRFNSGEKNLIQNLIKNINPASQEKTRKVIADIEGPKSSEQEIIENIDFEDLKIDDKLNVIYHELQKINKSKKAISSMTEDIALNNKMISAIDRSLMVYNLNIQAAIKEVQDEKSKIIKLG